MRLESVLNPKLIQDVAISRMEGVLNARMASILAQMEEPVYKFLVLVLTSIGYSKNVMPVTLDIN